MGNEEEFFIYIKSEVSKMNTSYSKIVLNDIEDMDCENYDGRLLLKMIYFLEQLDGIKLPNRYEYNKYIKPYL